MYLKLQVIRFQMAYKVFNKKTKGGGTLLNGTNRECRK